MLGAESPTQDLQWIKWITKALLGARQWCSHPSTNGQPVDSSLNVFEMPGWGCQKFHMKAHEVQMPRKEIHPHPD